MDPYTLIALSGSAAAAPVMTNSGYSVAIATQPDMTLTALLIFSVVYLTLIRLGTFRTLKSALLLFLSTSLAAGPTMADVQTGLYLGIGGGASRLMPGVVNARLDDRDSIGAAWNATAGYQLGRSLGLEFEYSNLGSTTLDPLGSIDYQDVNVSGLYHLGGVANGYDGRDFSMFGRLGVGKISNESDIQLQKGTGTHWLAGAGVQIPISPQLSLRGEGVYYAEDVSRAGLTLTYNLGKPRLPAIGPMVENVKDLFGSGTQTASSDQPRNMISNAPDDGQLVQVDIETLERDDQRQAQVANQTVSNASAAYNVSADGSILKLDAVTNDPVAQMQARNITVEEAVANVSEVEDDALFFSKNKPASFAEKEQILAKKQAMKQETRKRQLLGSNAFDQISDEQSRPVIAAALPLEQEKPVETVESEMVTPEAVNKPVLFHFDSNKVTPMSEEKLQPLVEYLVATPEAKITLTGHTDSVGTEQYNQALSIRRAEAVRKFLLQQGIDRKMIRILGAGEKRPVQSNASKAGRKANRRVSMVVD